MAEGRCSRSTPNAQPHLAVRCLLPANPPPWQCFSPRPPVFRSAFAPHTIVPPSGGTQPLPLNPNPLLPNQAPPELVAESSLDPVGTTPHPHHHIISHLPRPPNALRPSIISPAHFPCFSQVSLRSSSLKARQLRPLPLSSLQPLLSSPLPHPQNSHRSSSSSRLAHRRISCDFVNCSSRPLFLPHFAPYCLCNAKRRRLVSASGVSVSLSFHPYQTTQFCHRCVSLVNVLQMRRPSRAMRWHSLSPSPRVRCPLPCYSSCRCSSLDQLPLPLLPPLPATREWDFLCKFWASAVEKYCSRMRRTETAAVSA
jgi:hypothetical protein